MRVLYVTSEVYPLAKTGGLADVAGALPAAVRGLGVDIRVLVPGYRQALERSPGAKEIAQLGDVGGCGDARLLETILPGSHLRVWLIDCPELFDRAGGLYQDEDGADWPDNSRRYALFNHAAAAIATGAAACWRPDLVHANDWHTGLLPLLLSERQQPRPRTVFTIHNLAYQGLFEAEEFRCLGLPPNRFDDLEFYSRISFLKAGLRAADAITTVSPTYAREILTSEHGCGMDGILRARSAPVGILNGADYAIWNPSTDPHLPANFSAQVVAPKRACKAAVQSELGLEPDDSVPLMGFMSRLDHQKMPDVVLDALPSLIAEGMQFALVAEGNRELQSAFERLSQRHPGRMAVRIGYNEPLAHRLLGGADMLAHPARFEPCGLVPIYAMRYGTVPVVRKVGGIADTVVDATAEAIQKRTGTGFSFEAPTVSGFLQAARRALALYRQPITWRTLQRSAMERDFGWHASARAYIRLYESLVETGDEDAVDGIRAAAQ